MINTFKGRIIGPRVAPVCPCFKKNVIVTCTIVSFLSSSDGFLLKMVLILFLENNF